MGWTEVLKSWDWPYSLRCWMRRDFPISGVHQCRRFFIHEGKHDYSKPPR